MVPALSRYGVRMLATPAPAEGTFTERVFNLSAGPAAMPTDVMEQAAAEFCNFRGTGMGFLEQSHRDAGGPVQTAIEDAHNDIRTLLKVPDDYHVMFMQSGAVGQFSLMPMNLLGNHKKIDFGKSGFWSVRASTEAAKYAEINTCYDLGPDHNQEGIKAIPPTSEWDISPDAGYVHICANETISGVEYLQEPEGLDVPIVSDFTSTLLSRPVDVSKYGAIFASFGKNLGPAGACLVIVKDSLLKEREAHPLTPSVLDYRLQAHSEPIPSLVNTPPTFILYMGGLVFKRTLALGGVEAMAERAKKNSGAVYDLIDSSDGFYRNNVDPAWRSRTTVPMRIKDGDRDLETLFEKEAAEFDPPLFQLCGHPWFGGLRVTLYNGVPDEAVEATLAFMEHFAKKYR